MISQKIQVHTPDGVSNSFFYCPEGTGPWPAVIHYTDIAGIRPAYHTMAQRVADLGYAVLLPNVFYRTGEPPMFDFKPTMGEERTMKRLAEVSGPLTPEAMRRDATAYVDALAARDGVRRGPFAVVGYCITGAMAVRTAAARPDKIAGAASFHGGGLCTDTPASPHLLLSQVKGRLYFGHAVQDRSMTEEAIAKFDQALAAWGGMYASEVYPGSLHGWTTLDGPAYNQPQAERAFTKLAELLRQSLDSQGKAA